MQLFRRLFTAVTLALLVLSNISAQDKKPLSHDDYDIWNSIENSMISNDGQLISYEINPQEGDGTLWIYNAAAQSYLDFSRGYDAAFSPGGEFIAFRIKAQFDTIRQAKLDGKKKDDLPGDSLGIYLPGRDSLVVVPDIKSFKVPKEGQPWVAWLLEKKQDASDTTASSHGLGGSGTGIHSNQPCSSITLTRVPPGLLVHSPPTTRARVSAMPVSRTLTSGATSVVPATVSVPVRAGLVVSP